jgi:hypothetical protein
MAIPPNAPPPTPAEEAEGRRRFRRTLVRVMLVQVITLVLLWILQHTFTP